MNKDARNAPITAKVFLEGLILMCVTEQDHSPTRHCELGILACANHHARITLETRGEQVTTGFKEYYEINNDIYIHVVNPVEPGVKLRSEGDVMDFIKYIPDLEGPRMHNDSIDVGEEFLRAKIAINAGEFYTHEPTGDMYDLIGWSSAAPTGARLRAWGYLVDKLAINIVCRDVEGSGIAIYKVVNNIGTRIKWLPKLADESHYEMKIENDCGSNGPEGLGSDFRFYYDVVTPNENRRFDFRKLGGPSPDVCEVGYLSKTRSFGFTFRPTG